MSLMSRLLSGIQQKFAIIMIVHHCSSLAIILVYILRSHCASTDGTQHTLLTKTLLDCLRWAGQTNRNQAHVWPVHGIEWEKEASTLHDVEVLGHSRPRLVRHHACTVIANPAVDTTTSRIHPQELLKSKILP